MARFLATVEYGQAGHEVLVEVWLRNDRRPDETTREEVEEVIRLLAHGGTVPEGWSVSAMAWQHPKSGKGLEGFDSAKLEAFGAMVDQSTVEVSDDDGRRKPGTPKRDKGESE